MRGELLVAINVVSFGGILGNKRTLLEKEGVLYEPVTRRKGLDIGHELFPRNAFERVANLGLEILGILLLFGVGDSLFHACFVDTLGLWVIAVSTKQVSKGLDEEDMPMGM
jgi:hypothetical protein